MNGRKVQGVVSVYGRRSGIAGGDIKPALDIYSKPLIPGRVMTPEFGAALCSALLAVKKRISVIVDKKGKVRAVFLGSDNDFEISSFLKNRRSGRGALRNCRLLRARADGRGLEEKDVAALINERLEMVGVIKASPDSSVRSAGFEVAFPLPPDEHSAGSPKWKTESFPDYRKADIDIESAVAPPANTRGNGRRFDRNFPLRSADRVFLACVGRGTQAEAEQSLRELESLAVSARKQVAGSRIYMVRSAASGNTVVGMEKLQYLLLLAKSEGADSVVFSSELKPSEISEIQKHSDIKIVDRTQLILEIFSLRASSKEGKIQVKLAELKYALPRLSGRGVQMSNPGAGIGTRGPGEKALEKQRRMLRKRISDLESEIERISSRRERTRKNRMRQGARLVSLAGYTNTGKSTLFSALTKERVLAADRMFSTLATKTRKIYRPSSASLLITDTVGFIKDLPEDLTKAFRATLEELGEADVLLHVADAQDPVVESKIDSVETIIESMGFGSVPRLLVFNKIDGAPDGRIKDLSFLYPQAVFVSALRRENLGGLLDRVDFMLGSSGCSLAV